jgi:hypothetical protein
MGNCLVTKLKEVVDNDNLQRLGKVAITFKAPSGHETDIQYHAIYLGFTENTRVFCENGHFTDVTMSLDQGTYKDFTANAAQGMSVTDGATIVFDKYNLFRLSSSFTFSSVYIVGKQNYIMTLDDFDYVTTLTTFDTPGYVSSQVCGNVKTLRSSTGLGSLSLMGSNIAGTLEDISNLPLTTITFANDRLDAGDVSLLFPNLESLIGWTDGTQVVHISWKNIRPNNYTIPNIGGSIITSPNINVGKDLDAMLINLASCTPLETPGKINVSGEHTEGSGWEDAIRTLRDTMGYTIGINGREITQEIVPPANS